MKKSLVFSAVLGIVSAVQAAQVEQVIVRQQWPWSTDVKIEFKLVDVAKPVDIAIAAYNGSTPLDSAALTATAKGDLYALASSGVYTVVVDPVKAFGTSTTALADFRVELSATDSPASMTEALYKIFDLATGNCTDVSRADILNGKYGSYETDYAKLGAGFNTSLTDVLVWTELTNNIAYMTDKLVMRKIDAKGKSFMMGTDPNVSSTYTGIIGDEIPYHQVSFTNDFYMSVFEVTQKQYANIVNGHVDTSKEVKYVWPSKYSNVDYRDARPVEKVSYATARGYTNGTGGLWPTNRTHEVASWSFMALLRDKTKNALVFDLPTEAQWEYACKGGTTTVLNCGTNLVYSSNGEDATMNLLGRYQRNGGLIKSGSSYAWPAADTTLEHGTARVGSYAPNAYGLYDMEGNVGEWCLDWYGGYPSEAVVDPAGVELAVAPRGAYRVYRGGDIGETSRYTRTTVRKFAAPTTFAENLGFRLCATLFE